MMAAMKDREQECLTRRVHRLFEGLHAHDTFAWAWGIGDSLPRRGKQHFDHSPVKALAQQVLREYVTSSHFKRGFVNQYLWPKHCFEVEEQGSELRLDGSLKFDLEDAPEVEDYITEISKLAQLYNASSTLRHWFIREFFRDEDGRTFLERVFRTMVGRHETLDVVLGYDVKIEADPDNIRRITAQRLQHKTPAFVVRSTAQYKEVLTLVRNDDRYALLFQDEGVRQLFHEAMRKGPESVQSRRLAVFLVQAEHSGIINAFEYYTPRSIEHDNHDANWITQMLTGEQRYIPCHSPELTPKWWYLQAIEQARYVERSAEEKKKFSRKIVNAVLGSTQGYDQFANAVLEEGARKIHLIDEQYWPAVVEELASQRGYKLLFDALKQEILEKRLQRSGAVLESVQSDAQRKFYTSGEMSKEVDIEGRRYLFTVERSLIQVMNALIDREKEINDWYREGSSAVARVLSDADHQFVSVYAASGTKMEVVGSVWIHGDHPAGRCSYYDEMRKENLAPLRGELKKFVKEFALQSGYDNLVFDPDGLIEGMRS